MRESFGQHLELIEAIDPKSWNPAELHKELSRALSAVDDARTEFSQQRSRLQATGEKASDAALPEVGPRSFRTQRRRTLTFPMGANRLRAQFAPHHFRIYRALSFFLDGHLRPVMLHASSFARLGHAVA